MAKTIGAPMPPPIMAAMPRARVAGRARAKVALHRIQQPKGALPAPGPGSVPDGYTPGTPGDDGAL